MRIQIVFLIIINKEENDKLISYDNTYKKQKEGEISVLGEKY